MTKATRIADSEALTSLFRASLDALPDALLILRDGETSFAFANRAAASLLRTSAEALLLLGPDDVLKAGQFRRNDALSSTGDDGTHWPGAWRARRRDGSLVPVLVNTSRIPETKATLMRLEPQTAHRTSRSADHVAQHGGDQHDRFALLATASMVLTSTSDYLAALDELARLALPSLGVCCFVHVVDGDGRFKRVAKAHLDESIGMLSDLLEPTDPMLLDLPQQARQTGIVVIRHAALADDPERAPLFVRGLAAPISLRGEVLGTLTFLTDDPSRHYDSDDAALGMELGRRVAQAMDSARLLQREQRRRRQLEAVREVASELTNELDLSRLLDLIILRVAQLADDSPGILYIWDEQLQRLMPRSTYKLDGFPVPIPTPLGLGASGLAAQKLRTIVVDDYRSWEKAQERLKDTSLGAALACPVVYQSRLVGVITLAREIGSPPFSPGQRDLVSLFADHAAVAIEHARLFEREQDRRRQLEAIRDVSYEITRELDLSRLLQLIWHRAAALVDGDRGALFLWDDEAQELHASVWPECFDEVRSVRLKPGEGAAGTVAQTRQGLVLNDYRSWPQALAHFVEVSPTIAYMVEPVLYQDRLIGVIGVGRSESGRPFTRSDQETLRLFGQHAAVAIENARLFDQEQRRRRQVEAIRDVAAEIARELDHVRVLELTFQRASELIRATFGWVYLWDENSSQLVPSATTAPMARMFNQPRPLGHGATGMAAELRRGFLVNDYPRWKHAIIPSGDDPVAQAALAAPILYQDRLVGVITLIRLEENDPFVPDELELLNLFADHAAIAIENARLYEKELRERQQLEAIRDLTTDIIRELDIRTVLELTIERATTLVRGKTGVVFEWVADEEVLKPRTAAGFDPTKPRPILKLGEGISGLAAETLQGIIENDYRNSPRRLGHVMTLADMHYAMAAPIVFKDRLIGVLTIGRTDPGEPFKPDDLELLCLFADHAAIAIEHARLYSELSERALQMKTLVGKVLRAQDEERRRVAYEVHDGLAQVAAATHQHLEAFASRFHPRSDAGRRELETARITAQQTVDEARRVIAGLRPTVLDDLGLASALRQEIGTLKKDGFSVIYEENLGARRLLQEVETTLFSIGREALTNVRKHAGMTNVEVHLTLQPDLVELAIRDWGRGFDLEKDRRGVDARERIGLRGMEERVAWLGGQLTLTSERGKGSRIVASVPLDVPSSGRIEQR